MRDNVPIVYVAPKNDLKRAWLRLWAAMMLWRGAKRSRKEGKDDEA